VSDRRRLGRLPYRHDPRTLHLADYITPNLPRVPATHDAATGVQSWPMYANDRIGDCTCAAAGHQVQAWTAAAGYPATPAENDVLHLYERVSGYDPASGANDNGAVELDVLNAWRKTGLGKDHIAAFAKVDHARHDLVKAAIYLFGGAYIGLDLPVSAQTQKRWALPRGGTTGKGAPGSWGGHAVNVVAYTRGHLTCVTWGQRMQMSWGFFDAYCSEAWALLSPDFFAIGKSPAGLDLDQLTRDLQAL